MGVAAVIGKLSVAAVFLLFLPLPWTDEVGWKDGGAAADRRIVGPGMGDSRDQH